MLDDRSYERQMRRVRAADGRLRGLPQAAHRHWLMLAIMVSMTSLIVGAWLGPTYGQQKKTNKNEENWRRERRAMGIPVVEAKLKFDTPAARNIRVGHVEGGPGDYMPDQSRGMFKNVKFTGASGKSRPNSHATQTARAIYGRYGHAPGVSSVYCYTTNHWLTNGFLRTGSPVGPAETDRHLFTHSWVGELGDAFGANALRRLDHAVDQQDVFVIAGVNNGRNTKVPAMLSSSYNVIAVGAQDGDSSGGYTKFEGEGRCKPDIVGPGAQTSFSTPMVAAIVARLIEQGQAIAEQGVVLPDDDLAQAILEGDDAVHGSANNDNDNAAAGNGQTKPVKRKNTPSSLRTETIRAVLLAGAIKPRNWKQAEGKPLDEYFGAGAVRFDTSQALFAEGNQEPGRVGKQGWSFQTIGRKETVEYEFYVGRNDGPKSIILCWNRRIDGRAVVDLRTNRRGWLDLPRLADFDMELLSVTVDGTETSIAKSGSNVDNVEHLYLRNLSRGRHILRITRKDKIDEPWDVALAWRTEENN